MQNNCKPMPKSINRKHNYLFFKDVDSSRPTFDSFVCLYHLLSDGTYQPPILSLVYHIVLAELSYEFLDEEGGVEVAFLFEMLR